MKTRLALAAAAAASLTAASVHAVTLDYSYTDAFLGITATWTQSESPTPSFALAGYFMEVPVTDGVTSVSPYSFASVDFYNRGIYPNDFEISLGGTNVITDDGPQLYTGSEADPIFTTGDYTLNKGVLDVSAVVPEPSTWLMFLVGLAGLGGTFRARRRRLAVA